MPTKTHQVQIRVTASEKAALRCLANRSGLDLSSYVLGRALPPNRLRFRDILQSLAAAEDSRAPTSAEGTKGAGDSKGVGGNNGAGGTSDEGSMADRRFALAELNDFLTALAPGEFPDAMADADVRELDTFTANYTAAMVEQAADQKRIPPPAWVKDVPPLDEPYFAGGLKRLRPHLLRAAPVPFKRRNIFVDSGLGDRV